jgi:hypothetical protein
MFESLKGTVLPFALVFAIVMYLTVALTDKFMKWLDRRKWNRILRTIDWPKEN